MDHAQEFSCDMRNVDPRFSSNLLEIFENTLEIAFACKSCAKTHNLGIHGDEQKQQTVSLFKIICLF